MSISKGEQQNCALELDISKNKANDKVHIYRNNTNILYEIRQQMNNNPELSKLIDLFSIQDNDIDRIKIIEEILICFTGANNIRDNTNLINSKHLHILNVLDKLSLISFSKKCSRHTYTEIELSDIVEREFENLKIELYAKLMQQLYYQKKFNFSDNKYIQNPISNNHINSD